MKSVRSMLALLLALLLTINLAPVSLGSAEISDDTASADMTQTIQVQHILYPKICLTSTDEQEYLTTVEAAAAVLRQGMKSRQAQITVPYFCEGGYDSTAYKKILDAAVVHTGVPTEGDYLLWHRGVCNISISYYPDCEGNVYATLVYNVEYYTTAEQEAQLDTEVKALLDKLDLWNASDYEKIVGVYEWMCQNIYYDYTNLGDSSYKLKYTAYAAMVNKTSVCQGYATLLYRLLLELGVDNRVITGIGNGGGHAWNIVKLQGLYYDVDATWDASWRQSGLDYRYFLLPDALFEDHSRDAEYADDAFNQAYPMAETPYKPSCAEHQYENNVCTQCGALRVPEVLSWSIPYVASGNVITVQYADVCKVGYLDAATGEYVQLQAVKNSDGSYSFAAPDMNAQLLIVAVGDVNGDGSLDAKDSELMAQLMLPFGVKTMTAAQRFAADVNGNGKLNAADRLLLARALASVDAPYYEPFAWWAEEP